MQQFPRCFFAVNWLRCVACGINIRLTHEICASIVVFWFELIYDTVDVCEREMENCAFCRDGFYSIHNPRVGVAALGVHFNNIGLQFQCRVQCRCCLLVLNSWEYINLPAFITRSYVTTPWVHQPLRFLVVRNGLLCPICRFLKVNVEIYH